MKKKIFALAAVLAMAMSLTACWDDDYDDTDSKAETTTETTVETASTTEEITVETTAETETTVETETSTEESTTEETTTTTEDTTEDTTQGGPPQGGPPQQTLNLDVEFDESKFLTYVDMPEANIVADAAEADFEGNWVCEVMAQDDVAYSAICAVPLYATDKLVITGDEAKDAEGSGTFLSVSPVLVGATTQGGPPAAAQQAQTSEDVVETVKQYTYVYTYADGKINASVTIPVGPPASVQSGAETPAVTIQGPPPKNVEVYMLDNGKLLVKSVDATGIVTSAFYKKVDQFEKFDWSSVNFDFASVYAE